MVIFFKGSQHTTILLMFTKDPKAVRWMLGFQYKPITKNMLSRSFCSELRGASLQKYLFIFVPRIVVYNFIIYIYNNFFKK